MIIGAIAALVQADMSPYKRSMLKTKGVNVNQLERQAGEHRTKADPYLANARAQSAYIKENKDNLATDEEVKNRFDGMKYYERVLIGIIDGFTKFNNEDC